MATDPEDLELAFQLHVVELVTSADLATSEREREFLERNFPADELRERGFLDEAGARTQKALDTAVEALSVLPTALDTAAKHDLLEACYRLAVVDRELRIGEGSVLLMASRLLGLPDEDFDAFLERHPEAVGMSAAFLDRE